jgi:hypothetical protein
LLQPKLTKGLVVTWDSRDIQAWNDHGSFDQQLGVPITLLYNGGAELKYVPKKEDANGAGTLVKIYAPLVLRADAFDLVDHVFDLGPFRETARNLLDGSEAIAMDRIAWPIEWHQVGNGYSVSILWRDIYNGIEDDIRFHGLIINKPQNPSPGLTFEGTGRAYGSRLGWKSCNPGFEGDITGSGKASFTAGIEGDQVVIGAFADANTPLSGILAGPFILQAKGDSSVQYPYPYGGGDLTCLHSIGWDMTATAVGDPLHP